jgi:hypothetical protein
MKQLAVTQFPMPILTISALMIFVIAFTLIAFWACRLLGKEKVQHLASLALATDTPASSFDEKNDDHTKKEGRP